MTINRLDPSEVSATAVRVLGLEDAFVDLFSAVGLCASLRRAASFLCPTSPRRLVDAVVDVLVPLGVHSSEMRDKLMEYVELLTSAGDFLELRESADGESRLLFLGPPSYVQRQPGSYLLLGVRPYGASLVDPGELGDAIAYEEHTRTILLDPKSADNVLMESGLVHITSEQWIGTPRRESYASVLQPIRERLHANRVPGQIHDLEIIDSTRSVRYYKGRWRPANASDSGLAIGRRPQTYGAPIWCALLFDQGITQAVLDLPIESTTTPAWDEARRLQAALDAERGRPQQYRVRGGGNSEETSVIDLFSPLPTWAERYLQLVGQPVQKSKAALFSYRAPHAVVDEIERLLNESLWMVEADEDVNER